jgi:hypothetical protein
MLALLDVPNRTRPAITLIERVVSRRNRAAIASLPASLLGRDAKSASCLAQPMQFFDDDPFGLGFGGFLPPLSRVMVAELTFQASTSAQAKAEALFTAS